MEIKDQALHILHRAWAKLQSLPKANPLEMGAFFVLILFVATFLFMIGLTCVHCYYSRKPKYHGPRVRPLQTI